jgi:hypothetical protein
MNVLAPVFEDVDSLQKQGFYLRTNCKFSTFDEKVLDKVFREKPQNLS